MIQVLYPGLVGGKGVRNYDRVSKISRVWLWIYDGATDPDYFKAVELRFQHPRPQ